MLTGTNSLENRTNRRLYSTVEKVANKPSRMLAVIAGEILIFGSLFSIIENKSWVDGIWWACVTGSTVGYGDFSPVTFLGRLIALTMMYTMILFIVPIVTALYASTLIVDRDKFSHEEQEELKESLRVTRDELKEVLAEARELLDSQAATKQAIDEAIVGINQVFGEVDSLEENGEAEVKRDNKVMQVLTEIKEILQPTKETAKA